MRAADGPRVLVATLMSRAPVWTQGCTPFCLPFIACVLWQAECAPMLLMNGEEDRVDNSTHELFAELHH